MGVWDLQNFRNQFLMGLKTFFSGVCVNFKDFLAILDRHVTGIIDNSLYRCNTVICSNLTQAILGPVVT
jgi:hypothetical protein